MLQFPYPSRSFHLSTFYPIGACLAASILLQSASQSRAQDPLPGPATAAMQALPPLDQLLAPIALYPDPLIALILPASTFPSDLQAAAGFVAANGDPSQIDGQPWDDSVKDLAHYPEVVQWMNSNLEWTQQLGAAFADSPTDVMNAIQDLRARAKAAGTLADCPEQTIVADGDEIDIEPAQPNVIYIPRYDPDVVYFGPAGGYSEGPFFTYGSPYPMGIWLGFDFDWQHHQLLAGNWYQWRQSHGGWRQPLISSGTKLPAETQAHAWRAPATAPRKAATPAAGPRQTYSRPAPMSGAPQSRRTAAPNSRAEASPPAKAEHAQPPSSPDDPDKRKEN